MTDTPPTDDTGQPGATAVPLDRRRQRRMRRIAGAGLLVGLVLAVLAGLGGATGRAGAAVFLLVGAASCAAGATYGVLTAVRDDLKGDGVSRTRAGWIIGLFFAAAALMAMTAGVGG